MGERDRRRDVTLHAEPGVYGIAGFEASFVMTSWLLLDWLAIAVRHEQEAHHARQDDNAGRERQAALIAVSACAHCLEGLGIALVRAEPQLRKTPIYKAASGRAAKFNARLAAGLNVEETLWLSRIGDLLETLRDPAVHPKVTENPPVAHPDRTRDVRVSKETALYSVENARLSVNLVCEVMTRLLNSKAAPAQAVASQIRPQVEHLIAERKRLADERHGKTAGK